MNDDKMYPAKNDEFYNEKLYHVTERANVQSIFESGMREGSYWTDNTELLEYYAEDMSDPVTLVVIMRDLILSRYAPDMPGIEEPITSVIGKDESEVQDAWCASAKKWMDSLHIVGSICYLDVIPMKMIMVDHDEDEMLLEDYIGLQYGDASNYQDDFPSMS